MERVKTDDNNMRIKGYLFDNQQFTPPPGRPKTQHFEHITVD